MARKESGDGLKDEKSKMTLVLNAEEIEGMRDVWEIVKKRMHDEVRERMGWERAEDFLADVLVFGMDRSSEEPQAFIREARERKDPIFREGKEKKVQKGLETAWGKAYA